MSLADFHRDYRSDILSTVADRVASDEGPFPSEELVFAETVMEHISQANISDSPTICHWNGTVGNSKLRITGYALSSDETALDLFVTHYFGTDELSELKDSEAAATAGEGIKFLLRSADGKLEAKIDPTHPVRNLVATIGSRWASLDRLRVFVLTDGVTKSKRFANKEVQGKMVSIEAMDIERLFRHTDGKPRDELALSLVQSIGRALPCVHVPDPDADYEYVLTAIPGTVIRDLYLKFGPQLLEANVRTFLGTKKTVNKGIIETLRTEPEHFLAFNNGLVLVCDEADFEQTEDGGTGLSFLKGLQIVNGGQTTSSIYFASRDDKTLDLSHVRVPAKIIILKGKNDDAREKLISNVSKYANSQNAVKLSDLSANRPFHVQLEKLANETWCPDGSTRWFYERAAGAYNVMLLRDGTTPARRKKLQDIVGPKRKLSKTDVAKYLEAWRGKPAQVAYAGEKNFAAFMSALDENATLVPNPLDPKWYKGLIAKVILYKAVEKMIKTKEAKDVFRQGWVNIATYVLAIVGDRLSDSIDLEQIWQQQDISKPFRELLWDWAVVVNAEFTRLAPGQQISEVAKRSAVWDEVRMAKFADPGKGIPELRSR